MPETYKGLIPVSRPSIGADELREVAKVFESGWLGLGAWVLKFECGIKELLGGSEVIAVNTGTSALHLALDAIGVKKGDEVILPSLTFAASVQAIIATGARPVFCDVEEESINMDAEDMKRRITRKTKAVMPVHFRGVPCDMDSILHIAKSKNLRVVEDAAHAFGSYYKGKRVGSFGDVTCFSFDPIKNITCGEGGAIITRDPKLASLIYKKRILGIDKDTWSRYKHKRDWFYNVSTPGYRYHMSNISAAIGMIQLRKFDKMISHKREIAKSYDRAFTGIRGLKIIQADYDTIAPFNYIIRAKKRDRLMAFLKRRGIDSGVHYIPNHLQPLFKDLKTRLSVTEKIWKEIITLPLYYDMGREDVECVIKALKGFFE